MAAALGGMVSRPVGDKQTPEPSPVTKSRGKGRTDVSPVAPVAPVTAIAPNLSASDGESEYRRTGTGYVKTDGTELVRTVVMMTEGERRRLKIEAMERGVSASDYVRRALGFLPNG